jgi:hypothetical protein
VSVNSDSIWRLPAYLPYLQPTLTESAIAAAEQAIGFSLPVEMLSLLRIQNGGYIRFSLPEMVHDSIAGIGPNFPSLTDVDWDGVQEYVSFPLQGLVPFDGDGHWHLCLDYRSDENAPSITYVDIECDSQMPIANSFAEYLGLLSLDVDDTFVVDSASEPELLNQLSNALSVEFCIPDRGAHGYPIHRAALGTSGDPQWLWVSPNRVIRGFVREDDCRYAEIKDLLPGFGLRFPEIGESSMIVDTTHKVRQRVIDACKICGINLRLMREVIKNN